MQLSFAVFPLVMFTSDKLKMGEFVNPRWLKDSFLGRGSRDRRAERLAVTGNRSRAGFRNAHDRFQPPASPTNSRFGLNY